MLSEVNQTQKGTYYMIPPRQGTGSSHIPGDRKQGGCPGNKGWFNEHKVSVLQYEESPGD